MAQAAETYATKSDVNRVLPAIVTYLEVEVEEVAAEKVLLGVVAHSNRGDIDARQLSFQIGLNRLDAATGRVAHPVVHHHGRMGGALDQDQEAEEWDHHHQWRAGHVVAKKGFVRHWSRRRGDAFWHLISGDRSAVVHSIGCARE